MSLNFLCDLPAAQKFKYPLQELQNVFQIEVFLFFCRQILNYMLSRLVTRAVFWNFYGRHRSLYGTARYLYGRGHCLHRRVCHFYGSSISTEQLTISSEQSAFCTEHFAVCTEEVGFYESPLYLHGTKLIFYGTSICLVGHRTRYSSVVPCNERWIKPVWKYSRCQPA